MNTSEVRLSAVIVTYNEARYIPRCLAGLSFCDEILVVDIGSTDNSIQVARDLGARVIQHPWVPFAEKARSSIVKEANYDWIVFADPDLYFSETFGDQIRALIRSQDENGLAAIYLPIYTGVGGEVLRYGQKGGRRGFRAVIHRERNEYKGFVHHSGVLMRDDCIELCLPAYTKDAIFHDWIDSIQDALGKARRYFPYEAESRISKGMSFGWRVTFKEMWISLKRDLYKRAFLDWNATQVMFFQLWYIWNANMCLRRELRQHQTKKDQ